MSSSLGPGVCSKLRTKTMYLNVEYRREGDEPECGNSAVFWCLKTHGCLGPDDGQASPDSCRSPRPCAVVFPEI